MSKFTKQSIAALALAACAGLAGQTQAGVISVDETITKTPPPAFINGSGNFVFNFNNLPTSPLTDGSLRISGTWIDVDGIGNLGPDETVTVHVDGVALGTFGPFGDPPAPASFTQSIGIPLAALTVYLADGHLQVRVDLGTGVDADWSGSGPPSLSANIAYRAEVPEPASLALLGLGLASLGFGRRKRT